MTPELTVARERWLETMKAYREACEAVIACATPSPTREKELSEDMHVNWECYTPEPGENEFVAFMASQIIAEEEEADANKA